MWFAESGRLRRGAWVETHAAIRLGLRPAPAARARIWIRQGRLDAAFGWGRTPARGSVPVVVGLGPSCVTVGPMSPSLTTRVSATPRVPRVRLPADNPDEAAGYLLRSEKTYQSAHSPQEFPERSTRAITRNSKTAGQARIAHTVNRHHSRGVHPRPMSQLIRTSPLTR